MLRSKIMASVLVVCLLSPVRAFADDPPADIAIITHPGVVVPFPGVLMSNQAYAKAQADREVASQRCDDRVRLETGLLSAHKDLTTATTAADLRSLRTLCDERLKIRDDRIKQLTDQLASADERAHSSGWERVGFFVAGMAAVVLGGLAVHLASK